MAEAVPVCDALCEAIEYLSRLGSNLRVRSENFKQKKLRKDRLRNTHAVQKAANKVLLICELSKKSILNVEDGVKQILTQIDAAQGSNKFKKNVQESTREIVYEYFEYDSQRLKIRNKINLKHFTSVKVLTKAMPLSMLNDYPLYYACNLHHLREEQDKQKSDDHQLTEIKKLNNSNDEDHSEVTDKSNNIEKSGSTPTKQKDHVENTEIKKKSPTTKHKKYKHIKVVDDDSADSNYNVDNLQTNENIVHDNDTGNTEIVNVSSKNKEINMEEENIQQSSNVEDTVLSESIHVSGEENTSECSSARRDTKGDKKNAEDTSLDTTEKMDTDMIDTTKIDREDQMSSHSDKNTNDSKIEINNINMDVEKCVNTSLLNDLHTVSNDVPNKNIAKESNSETKSNSDDNSHCSTDSKPLIKCVNINKLLRKDKIPKTKESVIEILDSDTDDEITVKNKKHRHHENSKKYKLRRKSKLSLIKCTKDSITHRDSYPQISDDEDFWKNKRKEVKKFKPKQFTVNIVRMPKLTEHFLYKYNLNKIIQNGSIVCEIPVENGNTGLKQHKSNTQLTIESKSSENKSIKEVNVVKHTLLNDSLSDCEKETGNCNELKKALLNESDILDEQEKAKSEESGDDKNSDKSMHKDNQKSATLSEQESQNTNDSSDTNSKSKKRKRKSRKSISPLVSKRKRIMKSVHAKKMLLNCSTSSDTEDEVVKDVLKNIKDSLLRGESDEDIEMKENSGSDGEVTKSNLNQINSESDISSKDTNSQKNTEVNSEMVRNIERAKSEGSEDDENSEKSINKDKIQSKTSSEQESENNNDSSKSPSLSKQKHIKRSVHAKKNLLNYSSSSDTEDEGVRNALKNIKDCLLKGESDEDIEKKSGSDGEVTKSNTRSSQGRSNSECDISIKGTNSQGNEVDTNSSSEKVRH